MIDNESPNFVVVGIDAKVIDVGMTASVDSSLYQPYMVPLGSFALYSLCCKGSHVQSNCYPGPSDPLVIHRS